MGNSIDAVAPSQGGGLDISALEQALGFQLRCADQNLQRKFWSRFEGFDINPMQYWILLLVSNNPGSRQKDLASALGLHAPNLAIQIDALVKRELVARIADPMDRRAKSLRLTRMGKRFVSQLEKTYDEHRDWLRQVIGDADLHHLVTILNKLNAASQA